MSGLRIATYKDLLNVRVVENEEPFVPVNAYDDEILYGALYTKSTEGATLDSYDGFIVVRRSVAKLLAKVNKRLMRLERDWVLYVSYGYRSMETQTKRFYEELEKCAIEDEDARKEKVHEIIAYPPVAGHPTGGAVDLTIYNKITDTFLDMGCEIANFEKGNFPTFSEGLTARQRENRALLCTLMTWFGFFPYFGEWWHYGFGDKEWAHYFNMPHAHYDQVQKSAIVFQPK